MSMRKIMLILALCVPFVFCAPSQTKIAQEKEKAAQNEYEKAVVAVKYGFLDQALEYVNQSIALDPNYYKSYNLLGLVHFRKKNYAESAAAYEKCLEFKPDSAEVHNSLGFLYQEMGLAEKAEEEYKTSYSLDNNHDASFNLSKLYLGQNTLELALDYVQKSIQKNNLSAAAYNLQGVILNKMGKFPDAVESFQIALKIAPNDVITNVNLGIAYLNNQEFSKAREILEKVLPLVEDQSLKAKISEYLEAIKDREQTGEAS